MKGYLKRNRMTQIRLPAMSKRTTKNDAYFVIEEFCLYTPITTLVELAHLSG